MTLPMPTAHIMDIFTVLLLASIIAVLMIAVIISNKMEQKQYRFRSNGTTSRCACGKLIDPSRTICIECYCLHLEAKKKVGK